MDINTLIDHQKIVNWRRHLHMYPELSFKEYETTKYIVDQLSSYPELEILRPTETGVVAVLKGAKPGKVVGLRADIDALAIEEEVEVEFKSKNPGVMHACGHDCNTAMLLGAVNALYKIKDKLCGTIKFIFQHAEEKLPGGAREIVMSGVLDDVQAFYGCHIYIGAPLGTVNGSAGPVFANIDRFIIQILGKGCHVMQLEKSIDPVLIGAEIVQALSSIVARNVPSTESASVLVQYFHSSTESKSVPDTAEIKGKLYSFTPEIRNLIEQRIKTIALNICAAFGAKCDLICERGYSSVFNDETLCKLFKKVTLETLPEVKIEKQELCMGGEDFSAYSTIAPSFYSWIGAKPNAGEQPEGHHPNFCVNEDALPIGAVLYAAFAIRAAQS